MIGPCMRCCNLTYDQSCLEIPLVLCAGAVELDMDKEVHSPQQTVSPCHASSDSVVGKPAAPQLPSKRPLETMSEPKAQGSGSVSAGAQFRAMCKNTSGAAALPPNKRACMQQAAKSPESAPAPPEKAVKAPSAQPPCQLQPKPAQQPSQQLHHACVDAEMIEAKPRPAQPPQKVLQTQQAAAQSTGAKAPAAVMLQEAEVPEEVRQWQLKARQRLASRAQSKQNADEQLTQQQAREKARQEATQELLEFERSVLPDIPGNARPSPHGLTPTLSLQMLQVQSAIVFLQRRYN
jgi:hypothetical protein